MRPQTLLLTFLGKAVLGRDIAVFSGSYLAVMERLGISEQATRSTLTRMVNHGLLARHRHGRKMYFGLTPRAEAVLAEGEHRLWRAGAVNRDADGPWTLLGFSLPESRRDERHVLRSRLRWAGFGLLRSGMWIAPGRVDVAALLPDGQLRDHVQVFYAEPADRQLSGRWSATPTTCPRSPGWYQRFLRRWDSPRPLPTAPDDLARQLWLVSEWLLILRGDSPCRVRRSAPWLPGRFGKGRGGPHGQPDPPRRGTAQRVQAVPLRVNWVGALLVPL